MDPWRISDELWKRYSEDFGSPDYNTTFNAYKYVQEILVNDNLAPEILSGCTPASANLYCDSTTNDPNLFNFPNIGNIGETPATVSISAKDGCSGTNIVISYEIKLDFDADGIPDQTFTNAAPQAGWGLATVVSGGQKTATVQNAAVAVTVFNPCLDRQDFASFPGRRKHNLPGTL